MQRPYEIYFKGLSSASHLNRYILSLLMPQYNCSLIQRSRAITTFSLWGKTCKNCVSLKDNHFWCCWSDRAFEGEHYITKERTMIIMKKALHRIGYLSASNWYKKQAVVLVYLDLTEHKLQDDIWNSGNKSKIVMILTSFETLTTNYCI